MKLRRITLRQLLLMVALVALTLHAYNLVRWSRKYSFAMETHAHMLHTCRYNRGVGYCGEADLTMWDACIGHEERMIQKYRWAMLFPWMPVEPDPEPPSPFVELRWLELESLSGF